MRAVDGVTFTINKGEKFGVVGESGCGKSVCALSVMRLIERPAGEIVTGQILFHDVDLLGLSEEEMRFVRGGQIAMIFQDPMTALNPVFTIGNQLMETIMLHQRVGKSEAFDEAITSFAIDYADQNERDHAALERAIKSGKIAAVFEDDK